MSARRERVGIVGTRLQHPEFWGVVAAYINELDRNAIIVTGDCETGIDFIVRTIAIDRGRSLVVFYAKGRWNSIGYSAGPERNTLVAEYVDRLIAFPCGKSSGTRDVIRKAKKLDKCVDVRELEKG